MQRANALLSGGSNCRGSVETLITRSPHALQDVALVGFSEVGQRVSCQHLHAGDRGHGGGMENDQGTQLALCPGKRALPCRHLAP